MAKQTERSDSRGSGTSSSGSVRDEGRYDTETQQLPALPAEPDFHINTSALRRAFPDFSQYGSSEEDSIELGRGLKRNVKNTGTKSLASADVSENVSFTLGDGDRYQITTTPPVKPRAMNTKSTGPELKTNMSSKRTTSAKENIDPLARTTDHSTRSNNHDARQRRRSLTQIQASVESDDSVVVGGGRSISTAHGTKNTRFGRNQGLEQEIQNNTITSASAGNGTYQSFMLPDIPNITELVSGVRQDGTPLFTRSAKSRSRFGTPLQAQRAKLTHVPITHVPIPVEEKALYISLQLLQDKVMDLESEKTKTENKLEEYELEVLQLRSKLEDQDRARRNDSGLGTDSDEARSRNERMEKSNFEFSMKTLQDRLDRANVKLCASDVTISNLTKDRNAAHQQLAVAYVNSEELRSESENVRKEIEGVKDLAAQMTREHEKRIDMLTRQEMELRAKITRREKAINEMGSLAKELWATRKELTSTKAQHDDPSDRTDAIGQTVPVKKQEEQRGIPQAYSRFSSNVGASRFQSRAVPKIQSAHGETRTQPRPLSQSALDDLSRHDFDDGGSTTDIQLVSMPQDEALKKDFTYLSFMEGDEIAKLKQIVDEDKALLVKSGGSAPQQQIKHSTEPGRSTRALPAPRRSSLKATAQRYEENTNRLNVGNDGERDHEKTQEQLNDAEANPINHSRPVVSFSRDKEDTQRSFMSQRSERPRRTDTGVATEVTSAFILPDITLTGAALAGRALAGETLHGGKTSLRVPRPVPVSDRMPVSTADEEDATVRPAQHPGLALATVLKGLEDELAQLRQQASQQEDLYNQHDPALSKRTRKAVYARIQKLLAAIDLRADQIYALYDVLEGQKQKGQLMQEEEVEVTLQNIGIDPATVRKITQQQAKKDGDHDQHEDAMSQIDDDGSEDDLREDDEELAWEGIEPTQTHTLGSMRSLRVR